jgi:hypothetical protein
MPAKKQPQEEAPQEEVPQQEPQQAEPLQAPDPDSMTKDELLAEAGRLGVQGVDSSMTKQEIVDAIAAWEAEQRCIQCGQPASRRTINPAVNSVMYCDRHADASGEPTEPLG